MPETGKRGLLRSGLWVVLFTAGCRSARMDPYRDVPTETLIERARAAHETGDLREALRQAEATLERETAAEVTQEALYLAGRGRLVFGHRRQAYRHFETLIEDYPFSRYVPLLEEHVYAIGTWYSTRKPWRVFGDLFSGRPFGVEVLRRFAATWPGSTQADDAMARIAQYYYGREEYDFAADRYESLVQQYPQSEWYDLALYRTGRSRMLFSRGPGYDDTPLQEARKDLLRYLSLLPQGGHAGAAQADLALTEEMLARNELDVARFYLARRVPRGARIHLANAVLLYPETGAADAARELLAARGWDLSLNTVEALAESGREGS